MITESNTAATHAPEGSPNKYKLRRAKYDALKAEAIVPQVMHLNQDLGCTKLCTNGRFALKATCFTRIGNADFPQKQALL